MSRKMIDAGEKMLILDEPDPDTTDGLKLNKCQDCQMND